MKDFINKIECILLTVTYLVNINILRLSVSKQNLL